MTTIASLGLQIDSGDAVEAKDNLEQLAEAGAKAEKSADSMATGFKKAASEAAGLATAEAKVAETTEEAMARLTAMAKASLDASEYHKSLAASLTSTTTAMGSASSAATDWSAYQAEINVRGKSLIETEERLAESARQAAAAAGIQGAGLQALLGKINPAAAALEKLDQQQAALQKYRSAGLLDADTFREYDARIESSRQKLGEFDEGLRKTGVSSAQTEAALRQLPAQFTDIFTSLAGGQNPLMVLIQQGGQIKDSFGGIEETFDALKAKFLSLFSGVSGGAGLGESLLEVATSSKEVADNAGEAGESLSDLAEQTNTAAEAAGNAKTAIDAVGPSVSSASLSFWGIAGALTAAAAAIGTFIYGYSQGSREADEYNKSLILTGNYAGTTASALGDMARRVSEVNGTVSGAAEILAALAGNGKIAGESFELIANSAVAMEDATGRAVESTVSEFVKIADDPVKAAKELDDQYHFLTASVYSQIVALKEQGDTIGATKLLTETYADTVSDRTKEITDNLGLIESAWKGIKDSAAAAVDGILNIGRVSTVAEQIADVERRIAMTQAGGFGLFTNRQRALAILRDEKVFLEDKLKAEADIAQYDAEQAKSQKDATSAMVRVDALTRSSLTNEQKRTEEIKKYRRDLEAIRKEDPNDARLNADTVAKNIYNIESKYKDQKGRTSEVDLTSFNDQKNALSAILGEYKNHQRELDAAQKAGLISQESYAAQRAAIIEQQKGDVTFAYEAEIKALEDAKGKSTTSAQQRIQLDQKIADARAAMVKAQKDADTELAVLATNEQGRLAKQAAATQAYVDQLERQRAALSTSGDRSAAAIGLGDRQAGLQRDLDGATDRFNDERAKLLDRRRTAPDKYSEDDYQRDLAILSKAEEEYRDTVVDNYDKISAAQGDWRKGASSAFQNYLDQARDVAGQTKSLFTNAFTSMEDAVVNFAMTGKFSFADFTKSILADMVRIETQRAASGLLGSLVSWGATAASAWFGGGTTSAGSTQAGYAPEIMDNFVSGQRAGGGPVAANSLYQVNELGPELLSQGGKTYLMMGDQGGTITPLGSGPSPTLTATSSSGTMISVSAPVNVAVADRSDEGMELDQTLLQQNMQKQMQLAAEKAVADSWRPGGVSYRNTKGGR
ncbi:phage tail tape measure protein [Pseudomonas monteilii]|uniref:phage tail tape measure protein n=1 Tax=Pseudomonas monteilii TaxID=76759 RepID=UPI001E63E44E|nr:phage tail tape measure protein [Pseudomonas monteilii]MCE1010289.1 phage tail tape measure protein [Pseudomonas monteilii]